MAELGTAFADYAGLSEDAVPGSDRAEVEILAQQPGVDFGGRLVGEAGRLQQVEDSLLLRRGEGPWGFCALTGDAGQCGAPGAMAL